jgi:hypothetical protein
MLKALWKSATWMPALWCGSLWRTKAIPSLRASDALHLAAALSSGCTTMITYDRRLADASRRHGLAVFPKSGFADVPRPADPTSGGAGAFSADTAGRAGLE